MVLTGFRLIRPDHFTRRIRARGHDPAERHEVGPGTQLDLRPVEEEVGRIFPQTEITAVKPGQIGCIWGDIADAERPHARCRSQAVLIEPVEHGRKPWATVAPRGQRRGHPGTFAAPNRAAGSAAKARRTAGDPTCVTAHLIPARLNALVAEVSVTVRAAVPAEIEANGICTCCG